MKKQIKTQTAAVKKLNRKAMKAVKGGLGQIEGESYTQKHK